MRQRFEQDKNRIEMKEYGLGLGLYLAHSIIGRFCGEVSLRERLHGGVTTRIRLPLERLILQPA